MKTVDASAAYVSNFYSLIDREMEEADFTPTERRAIEDPVYYYGRYINRLTRPYFEETVVPVISEALDWLRQPQSSYVLDLGCGLAMQSIILAALGNKVLAVDRQPEVVALAKKRKRYYESVLGRELAIEFVCSDFLKLDTTTYEGQMDSVFSMSAFSYIQPLEDTVSIIAKLCNQNARVFLFEENSSNIVARLFFQRGVPRPLTVREQFARHGFVAHEMKGTCALPKQLWAYPMANDLVRSTDQVLRKSMYLAFSYALMMERGERTPKTTCNKLEAG